MLLRELLISEYGELIDKIVRATTLAKNEASRDFIATTLVRSMNVAKVKEPSQCPVAIIAEALLAYQKSNAWPPKFVEFIDEMMGLTKLPYSTVRSSITNFHWNIPDYLRYKKKPAKGQMERVAVTKPEPPEPTAKEVKEKMKFAWQKVPNKEEVVKLNDNYHVVIDFGAFKITIEKVKDESTTTGKTQNHKNQAYRQFLLI